MCNEQIIRKAPRLVMMTAHRQFLTDTPFPGDDGSADPKLRELLAAAGSGGAVDYLRAVAALCTGRLLVPVVATPSTAVAETDPTTSTTGAASAGWSPAEAPATDAAATAKEAEMAVALLQTVDGRRGLAVFTGLDTLNEWNRDARPVPVTVDLAAGSARRDGAEALVIDVDGPHPLAIHDEVLAQLATGHRLIEVEPEQFGWILPAHPTG